MKPQHSPGHRTQEPGAHAGWGMLQEGLGRGGGRSGQPAKWGVPAGLPVWCLWKFTRAVVFWTLTQRPCLGCQSHLDAGSHLRQVGHMHLIHEE